jgi:predicted nucleic acid-binding Zn ribbon protein
MRDLLRHRQGERARRRTTEAAKPREVSTHEQLAQMRRELNGLVAAWFHRTGQPHGVTHAALRKECGGPAAAAANAVQLEKRIEKIRDWATRG